jgi:hypothetical protein
VLEIHRTSPRDQESGHWYVAWDDEVMLSCPSCSAQADLEDYEIDTDGIVHPEFECPSCEASQSIKLLSWPR